MQTTQNTSFPKHFLWGASTSSFQFEGGATLGNKGISVQDLQQPNPGCCDFACMAGLGCIITPSPADRV